jgi:hypothetical protein
MKEKLQRGIKKYKNKFIVIGILWIVLSIVFVSPIGVASKDASINGKFDFSIFMEKISPLIINPFKSLGMALSYEYIGSFWGLLWKSSLVYFLFMILGIIRYVPKGDYGDIEHGSSDWSENGEQYKVLSRNKGILLAEKTYLPVDKRGNVNVLVVGRFRFW